MVKLGLIGLNAEQCSFVWLNVGKCGTVGYSVVKVSVRKCCTVWCFMIQCSALCSVVKYVRVNCV